MRSEFEKYIREKSDFTSDFQVGCNGQYKSDLMHFMFITWQHQQTKVDELQSMFVEQARTASNQQAKIDELQKRVDGVKQLIEDYKDPNITSDKSFQHGLLLVAIELEQALKGGEG